MRVLDLDGTAYERGLGQGQVLRDSFEGLFRDLIASTEWKTHKPPMFPDRALWPALALAGRGATWPSVRRHLPEQAERVRGLADGLGIRRSVAWGVQFLEVAFCEAGSSLAPPPPIGCTVVHATPQATASGRMLVGRNYDFPHLLADYQAVRREIPSDPKRLATTTITQAPLAGTHMGVNEAGVTISANNARLWRGAHLKYRGVPFSMLVQEALETCRTADEAVELVSRFPSRSNAGFVAIADESGASYVVEYTASETAIRRPCGQGVLSQANHFSALPHANLPEGTRWVVEGMTDVVYLDGSRARQDVAGRALRAAAGTIEMQTLRQVLCDHDGHDQGHDGTVCAHGLKGGTLSSILVEPDSRTMWATDGNPCQASYEEIAFRSRQEGAARAAK